MQKNRDCTEESGRTSVDTESLSFGAALLWGFAGCLLWGALCDVTRAEGQSTLLLETSTSSSGLSSLPSALLLESFLPNVFHDDNRYYRLSRGTFVHRTGYSLRRLVVTRDDRAQNTINLLPKYSAPEQQSASLPLIIRSNTATGQGPGNDGLSMQLRWRSNGGSQVLTRIHSHDVSNTSLEGVDTLSNSVPDRSLDS
jgi:hypothetical protein